MKTKTFAHMVDGYVKAARFTGLVSIVFLLSLDAAFAQPMARERLTYDMRVTAPYKAIYLGPVHPAFLGGLSNSEPLKAVGINSVGHAFSCVVESGHATCTELSTSASGAAAVNKAGTTAVGYADGVHAAWFSDGPTIPLDVRRGSDSYSTCFSPSPYGINQVLAVNDANVAVGVCHAPVEKQPVVWSLSNKGTVLPTHANPQGYPSNAMAFGINNMGVIVGQEVKEAVVWANSDVLPKSLGFKGDSSASGISDTGFISGNARVQVGSISNVNGQVMPVVQTRGFLKPPGGKIVVTQLPVAGDFDNSDAKKVNNEGLSVGFMKKDTDWNTARATIWDAKGAYADLTANTAYLTEGTVFTYAADINDKGDVLVVGKLPWDNKIHGFILVKTSIPLTFNPLSSGY